MNATIRDNILFGQPYEEQRYTNVLKACALIRDLETLEGGDMTEIGEKGINLSGGQKQRVSLARAAYSRASIILLDDPLSAVDAPTAKHLFQECILKLMASRTVLLVTHAVALCLPDAELAVVLENGKIVETGNGRDILNGKINGGIADGTGSSNTTSNENGDHGSTNVKTIITSIENKGRIETETISLSSSKIDKAHSKKSNYSSEGKDQIISSDDKSQKKPISGKTSKTVTRITEDETHAKGAVSIEVYKAYARAAGGLSYFFLIILLFGFNHSLFITQDYWLQNWASADHPTVDQTNHYIYVYSAIASSAMLASLLMICAQTFGGYRASVKLHESLLNRVVKAPIRFFEVTPLGRIMNRFSRDIEEIDSGVMDAVGSFVQNCVKAIAVLFVVGSVTPVFLVGIIPVGKRIHPLFF